MAGKYVEERRSKSTEAPSETSILLEMRDLVIEGESDDQWQRIVHGINLKLHRGEVLGLIGESGAGKSTIGLAAMGYARPGCRITEGSILFDGQEIATAPDLLARRLRGVRIAYVAQSAAASFNPAQMLIDQCVEVPTVNKLMSLTEATENSVDLFNRLHLPNPNIIGYRYPHQVSGGQLQRMMTAMAMSCRPDLIIFDEPTTALDVTTQIGVLSAIRNVVEQFNTAAIYITHDLAVVAQLAHRIIVLRYGKLVEEGETRAIITEPREEYTKSLLSVRNLRTNATSKKQASTQVLKVDNIVAGYGRLEVLRNISFNVEKQRTVAIVGESGSGKSTVARAIMGLLPLRQGRISFYDRLLLPFRKRQKDDLRRIQMIYQASDTAVNPKHRVRDIIGRRLRLHLDLKGRAMDARVQELLQMIELDPDTYADRYPDELSGGQKQRVCIACALAAEPDLIICDEITSALDMLVAEDILRLLDRLQKELGLAYLFITHDLNTVRAIADQTIVMHNGQIIEQGTTEEVFAPPHHEYTEKLLASIPDMDPDWLTRVLHKQ